MEAAIDSQSQELNEVKIERAFPTPEEASAYAHSVLSLGNVRASPHTSAIQYSTRLAPHVWHIICF